MTGRSWTIYKSLNPPDVAHPASIPLNKLGEESNQQCRTCCCIPTKETSQPLAMQPCNRPTAMHVNLLPACRFAAPGGCRPAVNSYKHSDQFGTPCLRPTESMHTRGPTQHTNSNKPCLLQHATGANGGSASAPIGQHKCNALPAACTSILDAAGCCQLEAQAYTLATVVAALLRTQPSPAQKSASNWKLCRLPCRPAMTPDFW